MKIITIFPTNRKKWFADVRHRKLPDNILFGVNHIPSSAEANIVSVAPLLEYLANLFLWPLAWAFQSQFTRLNIGRAVLALPATKNAMVVISCVDSMNKALLFLKKLRFLRTPVICMAGNVMDGTERFPSLHRWLWSGADRVITHAPVDQQKLEHMGFGNRGVMIPVGSDGLFYHSYKGRTETHLVASIGSDRDRDYETLVRAARNLSDLKFEIHAATQRTDLPKNVRLVTDATPAMSRELLWNAAIVVIPLKETCRAAGQLALLDALLMKKPVIVSSTRGIVEPYQLRHGVSAFLVPPGRVDALIQAINVLHRNPSLRQKLGAEGRRLALRYTTKRYADKLLQVIKKILQKSVRPTS